MDVPRRASRLQTARERTAGRNISPVQHPNRVSSLLRANWTLSCLSTLCVLRTTVYLVAQIAFNVPGSTPPSVLVVSLPAQGRSPCSKMKAEKLLSPSTRSVVGRRFHPCLALPIFSSTGSISCRCMKPVVLVLFYSASAFSALHYIDIILCHCHCRPAAHPRQQHINKYQHPRYGTTLFYPTKLSV